MPTTKAGRSAMAATAAVVMTVAATIAALVSALLLPSSSLVILSSSLVLLSSNLVHPPRLKPAILLSVGSSADGVGWVSMKLGLNGVGVDQPRLPHQPSRRRSNLRLPQTRLPPLHSPTLCAPGRGRFHGVQQCSGKDAWTWTCRIMLHGPTRLSLGTIGSFGSACH